MVKNVLKVKNVLNYIVSFVTLVVLLNLASAGSLSVQGVGNFSLGTFNNTYLNDSTSVFSTWFQNNNSFIGNGTYTSNEIVLNSNAQVALTSLNWSWYEPLAASQGILDIPIFNMHFENDTKDSSISNASEPYGALNSNISFLSTGCIISGCISFANATQGLNFSETTLPLYTTSASQLNSTAFTIAFWYNSTSSNQQTIFNNSQTVGTGGITLTLKGPIITTVKLNGVMLDDGGSVCTGWCFFAVAYNSSGLAQTGFAYGGNSVQFGSIQTVQIKLSNNTFAQIATSNGSAQFLGRLDEFTIYNRTLNTTEISQLYREEINGGSGNSGFIDNYTNVTISVRARPTGGTWSSWTSFLVGGNATIPSLGFGNNIQYNATLISQSTNYSAFLNSLTFNYAPLPTQIAISPLVGQNFSASVNFSFIPIGFYGTSLNVTTYLQNSSGAFVNSTVNNFVANNTQGTNTTVQSIGGIYNWTLQVCDSSCVNTSFGNFTIDTVNPLAAIQTSPVTSANQTSLTVNFTFNPGDALTGVSNATVFVINSTGNAINNSLLGTGIITTLNYSASNSTPLNVSYPLYLCAVGGSGGSISSPTAINSINFTVDEQDASLPLSVIGHTFSDSCSALAISSTAEIAVKNVSQYVFTGANSSGTSTNNISYSVPLYGSNTVITTACGGQNSQGCYIALPLGCTNVTSQLSFATGGYSNTLIAVCQNQTQGNYTVNVTNNAGSFAGFTSVGAYVFPNNWINGSVVSTNITLLTAGNYSWKVQTCDLVNNCANTTFGNFTISSPNWLNPVVNSTANGSLTTFTVNWTANGARLQNATFELDNGTGILQNVTTISLTGSANQSNFTAILNSTVGATIRWAVFVYDNNSQLNSTPLQTFVTQTSSSPLWSLNSTNGTVAGTAVQFSVFWSVGIGVNNATFEIDNGNGTLQNVSTISLSGSNVFANFSYILNSSLNKTIRWQQFAWDTAGHLNSTALFTLNTTNSPSWNNSQVSGTTANGISIMSVDWNATAGLSSYVFSFDPGTGIFSNDSSVVILGSLNTSTTSKSLTSTVGATIRWQYYITDLQGNTNATSIFNFTTLSSGGGNPSGGGGGGGIYVPPVSNNTNGLAPESFACSSSSTCQSGLICNQLICAYPTPVFIVNQPNPTPSYITNGQSSTTVPILMTYTGTPTTTVTESVACSSAPNCLPCVLAQTSSLNVVKGTQLPNVLSCTLPVGGGNGTEYDMLVQYFEPISGQTKNLQVQIKTPNSASLTSQIFVGNALGDFLNTCVIGPVGSSCSITSTLSIGNIYIGYLVIIFGGIVLALGYRNSAIVLAMIFTEIIAIAWAFLR